MFVDLLSTIINSYGGELFSMVALVPTIFSMMMRATFHYDEFADKRILLKYFRGGLGDRIVAPSYGALKTCS